MSIYQSEGIVLRTYNLTDGDKAVVVFTRDYGIIRGYARGARKLKSKFGSSLEPLTVALFSFKQRENQDNVRFDGTYIQQSYFDLTINEELLNTTTYWCELLMEFLPPHLSDERVYRMAKACLEAITSNHTGLHTRQLSCYFEIWLLKLTGFLPDIKHCAKCNGKIKAGNISEIRANGLTCGNCSQKPSRTQEDIYRVLTNITTRSPKDFSKDNIKASDIIELSEFIRYIIKDAIEANYQKLLKN